MAIGQIQRLFSAFRAPKIASLLLLSLTWASIGLPAYAKDADCEAELENYVWSSVTARKFEELAGDVIEANSLFESLQRPIDLNLVTKGKQKLLILGEGRSEFGATLLRSSRDHNGLKDLSHIQVVDVLYAREPNLEFPDNYQAQLFQELNLRDKKGRPQRFDYVVSAWSITFVLAMVSPVEQRVILEKVLEHVASNGTILFWPTGVLRGAALKALNQTLEDLVRTKQIRAYRDHLDYLVISK